MSLKGCDCDVTRASIGPSVKSLRLYYGTYLDSKTRATTARGHWLRAHHRPGRHRRTVQLQPLSGERPERALFVVPGPDDLVHHLHPDAEDGADEVLPSPPLLELARQRSGRAVEGDRQEAVVPGMPGRLEAARHALGPQRLERSRQQGLLFRIHDTLLVPSGHPA